MGFSQTSLKIASWSWTLLVDLACQCHVGGVLPNLSSACGTEPSRLACLVYLLLIFGSSSWVSRRAWTVVWNLAVYRFWVGAVEVLHAVSSLFRVKDERDSAPRCLFCRCQSLLSLASGWMCSQRWLRNGALTSRSGAGRLCASGKQGMFPGAAAFRKQRKSYLTAHWMPAGLWFECCQFCSLSTPCQMT